MSGMAVPEKSVQSAITDALDLAGWLWHWCGDSRTCHGDPGLPDLVAVHPKAGQLLWIEAKADLGKVSPGQADWMAAPRASGADCRVVWPDEVPELIDDVLEAGGIRRAGR